MSGRALNFSQNQEAHNLSHVLDEASLSFSGNPPTWTHPLGSFQSFGQLSRGPLKHLDSETRAPFWRGRRKVSLELSNGRCNEATRLIREDTKHMTIICFSRNTRPKEHSRKLTRPSSVAQLDAEKKHGRNQSLPRERMPTPLLASRTGFPGLTVSGMEPADGPSRIQKDVSHRSEK